MTTFAIRHGRTGLYYGGRLPKTHVTVWRRRPSDALLFATMLEAESAMAGLGDALASASLIVAVRIRGPKPVRDMFEGGNGAATSPTAANRRGREARPARRRPAPNAASGGGEGRSVSRGNC